MRDRVTEIAERRSNAIHDRRKMITESNVVHSKDCIQAALDCLHAEASAIQTAASRVGESMAEAVKLLLCHKGKVVVTGLGKSGHIAQKIAATFCSTGTPAVFLHPAEAVHGDLGLYSPGDPTIMISKGGATEELLRLLPVLRQFESPLIGILGNLASPLAARVNLVLDARVNSEADPLNLAPTSSTTVALALGDALAVALMKAREFTDMDFARFHPAGSLGRALTLKVADVMHTGEDVAWVNGSASVKEVVVAMTQHPLGCAFVIEHDQLCGIITDGDLRRALQAHDDIRPLIAGEIMTAHPITIKSSMMLRDALQVMENRTSQISVLPVLDDEGQPAGLLRIHDVYQAGLA